MAADPTSDAMALSSYTLLGEECNVPLPPNKIVREINFGRFITLSSSTLPPLGAQSAQPEPVVLPIGFIVPTLAETRPTIGVPPIPELASKSIATTAPVSKHSVTDVGELIAHREIETDGGNGRVMLDASAIETLSNGGVATVPIIGLRHATVIQLDAGKAHDVRPPHVDEHQTIGDLQAFLAHPVVMSENGSEVPVALTAAHVRNLLAGEHVQLTVHGKPVLLAPQETQARVAAANSPARVATARLTPSAEWPARQSSAMGASAPRRAPDDASRSLSRVFEESAPQVGFYIPYRQRWTLQGYSRGGLLSSIALAPQEETTIELFTWDRNTRTFEQSSTADLEVTNESIDLTKDTKQVSNELTKDTNFHAEANIHADVNVKAVNVGGSVTGGGSSTTKDVARQTTDFIHEQTRKAALRVRASRQSKVSESRQFGSEQRTTRKIRNQNTCHTLNLDYFEVLVNYSVATECLRKEAMLVGLFEIPLSARVQWTRQTLRRFEPILRAALLDPTYKDGFAAARLLAARDQAFTAVCEKCVCADEGGAMEESDIEELQELREAAANVITIVNELARWDTDAWPQLALMEACPPDPNAPIPPNPMTMRSLHRWMFLRQIQDKAPGVWSGLLALASTNAGAASSALSPSKLKLLHATISAGDAEAASTGGVLLMDDKARQFLRGLLYGQGLWVYRNVRRSDIQGMQAIALIAIPDPLLAGIVGLVQQITGGGQVAQQIVTAAASQMGAAAVEGKFGFVFDDEGLTAALAAFEEAFAAWQQALADVLKNATQTADALNALVGSRNDEIRNAYPLSTVAEAREREEALLLHLADNSNYYAFTVYQARLSNGGAQLPALVSQSNGLISGAPLGMVGERVAFPVNVDITPPGVDPATLAKLRAWVDTQVRKNTQIDTTPEPLELALPTPGINVETRLGVCDSCEDYIAQTRALDLRTRTATARQMESEANRYELRVGGTTPNLDDPAPSRNEPAFTVHLEQNAMTP